MLQFKILWYLCDFGIYLSRISKNLLPILVVTLALSGGLNHIIFDFLFFLGVAEVLCCSNLILCWNLLADRTLLNKSLELLKILILLDCALRYSFLYIFREVFNCFWWMIWIDIIYKGFIYSFLYIFRETFNYF